MYLSPTYGHMTLSNTSVLLTLPWSLRRRVYNRICAVVSGPSRFPLSPEQAIAFDRYLEQGSHCGTQLNKGLSIGKCSAVLQRTSDRRKIEHSAKHHGGTQSDSGLQAAISLCETLEANFATEFGPILATIKGSALLQQCVGGRPSGRSIPPATPREAADEDSETAGRLAEGQRGAKTSPCIAGHGQGTDVPSDRAPRPRHDEIAAQGRSGATRIELQQRSDIAPAVTPKELRVLREGRQECGLVVCRGRPPQSEWNRLCWLRMEPGAPRIFDDRVAVTIHSIGRLTEDRLPLYARHVLASDFHLWKQMERQTDIITTGSNRYQRLSRHIDGPYTALNSGAPGPLSDRTGSWSSQDSHECTGAGPVSGVRTTAYKIQTKLPKEPSYVRYGLVAIVDAQGVLIALPTLGMNVLCKCVG
ncbi:hypothetical protein SARC_04551 [Sphaeroforma arctica JP610]|uniref:Uncharacterized protein n=1 Tax=Sphaeroforma arctica JP610 TaxID=667725 RepID=A0A0L0G2W5_9EUKA|nr:hypothetical protein SARC_04551 [Sphaeroforma arctica JP610]KNC83184.1 hypothetical protein SARC_04551 [Sphaeroforma arctica JP610]|eukprot:XP_014157086.1 hypothetical protein SARC_04551 [Sphaeroforma arctica JP610]